MLCYHFAFTAELKDSVLTSILRRAISSQKSDPTRRQHIEQTDWQNVKRTYFRSKKMNNLSILNSETYSSFIQCLKSNFIPMTLSISQTRLVYLLRLLLAIPSKILQLIPSSSSRPSALCHCPVRANALIKAVQLPSLRTAPEGLAYQ